MTLQEILALYERRGAARYGGEAVSQLEHALQCAHLAETEGRSPDLIAACLLHDLGQLLSDQADDVDEVHQYAALPVLRPLFPDAVLEPVKLHVDAKRYLCRTDPGYWDRLSSASKLPGRRTPPLAHYAQILSGLRPALELPGYASSLHP